jgi:chloride channel protein, CIC family
MLSVTTAAAARVRLLVSRLLRSMGFGEDAFLLVVAVVVGIVTAAAAVSFHELIYFIANLLYGRVDAQFLYGGPGIVMLVLWPALGGLVVGIVTNHVVRERQGRGVVDVLESVVRTSGFIRPTAAIEKIFTSAITIGSGGSCGAEGPILQIGAAVASGIGRLFRIARAHMPVIVGCGTAAGISAIFNSPLGGLLFTLEVILRDFSLRTVTPVVVASVIANLTTRGIFQLLDNPVTSIFTIPPTNFVFTWPQLANFLVLGIACGLVGVLFSKLMHLAEKRLVRMPLPPALRPAAGGAMLGMMGVFYIMIFGWIGTDSLKPIPPEMYPMPAFFGDGYGFIQLTLGAFFYSPNSFSPTFLLGMLAFLIIAKVLGTCLTLGSGGSGGIIAPSLFLGATVGGFVGMAFRYTGLFNDIRPEMYALIGMGAVLAAVVHAPLAAILILLDLTGRAIGGPGRMEIILPAMLASVVATGVARRIMADSIYTLSLRERGVSVGGHSEHVLLRRMNVEQVTLEPASVVQPSDPFQRVLDLMTQLQVSNFIVIDKQGHYIGMLTEDDINIALMQREAVPLLLVGELMRPDVPFVRNSDDLAHVLDVFTRHDVDHLPVCLEQSPGKVIGLISRAGLMRRYQDGLLS